jgi:hypothetical protein
VVLTVCFGAVAAVPHDARRSRGAHHSAVLTGARWLQVVERPGAALAGFMKKVGAVANAS